MESRDYDIILWGASGYTGRLAADYLAETCLNENIRWCIAGRNNTKLQSLSATLRIKYKLNENDINIMIIDSDNENDINKMTKSCQVIISMAGPFWLCGERIMKSCIDTNTHYLDITAELSWAADMKIKYSNLAENKQLKMINCCGFDFVPNDMMMYQLLKFLENERSDLMPLSPVNNKNNNRQPLTIYHMFRQSTPMVSGGTAYSGMELMSRKKLPELLSYFVDPYAHCHNKKAGNKVVSTFTEHQNTLQILPSYVPQVNGYCVPYVMTSLMHKYIHFSNELQGYPWGANLLYLGGELRHNIFAAYFFAFILWVEFILFAIISHGRKSLWNYVLPKQGQGPNIDQNAFGESILVAEGAGLDNNQSVVIKWRMDQGEAYMMAAMFATEAAKCIVKSMPECPQLYGVLTPSAALGEPYLKRLLSIEKLKVSASIEER